MFVNQTNFTERMDANKNVSIQIMKPFISERIYFTTRIDANIKHATAKKSPEILRSSMHVLHDEDEQLTQKKAETAASKPN